MISVKQWVVILAAALTGALALVSLAGQAGAATVEETLTISSDPGADSFTTKALFLGRFNVSVSGSSWAGTVDLQRSFDGGSTWVDVDSWTANTEAVVNEPQAAGLYYRIGMKNGGYTSGTVYLRLSK